MLQTPKFGLKYTAEVILKARSLADSLRGISSRKDVGDYLANQRVYPSSAMGLLGVAFYDLAKEEPVEEERELIRKNSSRITLLMDVADDVVDKRSTPLEDKVLFLERVRSNLFGEGVDYSADIEEQASYDLARAIHSQFREQRDLVNFNRFKGSINGLVGAAKEQFVSTNPDKLLDLACEIGGNVTDSLAIFGQSVGSFDSPSLRKAARNIGVYCQLLDHCCEMDDDLAEGSNTYATARIKLEGDTEKLRGEIRRYMFGLADQIVFDGFSLLSDSRQRAIYSALKKMVDVKYKVITRFTG